MIPLSLVRLQNEFKKVDEAIQDGTLNNVSVELPVKNQTKDFMKWNCVIYGREGTIWEGGEFKGTLEFNYNYPTECPIYRWKGLGLYKFYHLNVYESGKTCLDILSEAYTPTTTILEILLGLENLLYDPNPQSPTDFDQAVLFLENRKQYELNVRKFVKGYMQQTD